MEKGKVLYEEEKLDKKAFTILLSLSLLAFFLLVFLSLYITQSDEALITKSVKISALILAFIITSVTGFLIYMMVLILSKRLTIHEYGVDITGLFPIKDRFIPLSQIKKIRPRYLSKLNKLQETGLVLELQGERKLPVETGIFNEKLIRMKKAFNYLANREDNNLILEDPIIMTMIGKRINIEEKETLIKRVKGLSEEELLKMKKSIENGQIGFLVLIGMLFITGMFVLSSGVNVFLIMLGLVGLSILIIGFYKQARVNENLTTLKRTIKFELKNDEQILPDSIKMVKPFMDEPIYREIPDFSEKRWKKIQKYGRPPDPLLLIFSFFLLMYSLFGGFILISTGLISIYLGSLLPIGSFIFWLFYLLRSLHYNNIYQSILDYERITGKEVFLQGYEN